MFNFENIWSRTSNVLYDDEFYNNNNIFWFYFLNITNTVRTTSDQHNLIYLSKQ